MCANSLYWHDYETWGAKPSADKPSQFAGIRTDEELNIIEDPLVLYCQPVSDCLPHPQACLITGITPQLARQKGLPEPQFFQRIHAALSQPGTCGVGYNSIRFDDEVSRYGFYRNFYDPYEREWKNGNSRWDIIDMLRLVYALKPETLNWPLGDNGLPSFKLERLSVENGLEHSMAHDALADVHATIGMAKLIKQGQPKLYDYCYGLRLKARVKSLIDIDHKKPFLHISSRFSVANGCAALMVPLMQHPRNANSVICYDLSVDPKPLLSLPAAAIVERLFTRQTELPEGVERIPLKEVHLNRSPIVATAKLLDEQAAERLHIDKAACERHWLQLKDVDIKSKLTDIYQQASFIASTDPEQQLYDRFISEADRSLLANIREARPEQLAALSDQFSDERLRVLLFRYRARHYPDSLSPEEQSLWQEWRYHRFSDNAFGASITLDQYFELLERLREEQGHNEQLLDDLFDYGDQLLA